MHLVQAREATKATYQSCQVWSKKVKAKLYMVWFLRKTLFPALSKDLPTWAACNSILGRKASKIVAMMLPVVSGSPASGDNLYMTLKEVEKVQREVQ